MTNTYLLEVIKALQPIKQQEIAVLLASPLYNRAGNAKEMARLYQIIMEAAPEYSANLLNKEKVYFQVFPDKKVIHRKLDRLMADLNVFLRNYALAARYLSENNEDQQQMDWAVWLREHGLPERSRQVIEKLKTQKNNEPEESLERYRVNWLIAEEEHMWRVTYNQMKGDLNIPQLTDHLDLYYHNYRIDRANRYLLQRKGAPLPELDFAEKNEDSCLKKSVLLQISKKIFEILGNDYPTTEEARSLMELLHQHQGILSFQTLDHCYAYLRNFCTLLIIDGHLEFIPVLHSINKDNLSRGYFFLNGKLPLHAYVNIVQISIKAKDFEWAKAFTESYRYQLVEGDESRIFYRLNMAQCLFAESKYEKALDYIPDAPSGFTYQHLIRRLEIKIYYELRSDLLLYKIDSLRKFIVRTAPKMIAANIRTGNLNFLNILFQISQSAPKDKARSAVLIERITSKKLISDRSWLLDKARELG